MDGMIARLQVLRSSPSHVRAGSIFRVELILSSEFNEPIAGRLQQVLISATFVSETVAEAIDGQLRLSMQRGEVGVFELSAPSITGAYQLHFCAREQNNKSDGDAEAETDELTAMMLRLHTEAVTVHASIADCERRPLLSVYRSLPRLSITIREDYGATLGSHIYDCAIVLLQFLRTAALSAAADREGSPSAAWTGTAVELGSGCGLVGLWLSSLFARVHLTDKACQLPLLRENIALSGRQGRCEASSLDWADASGTEMRALQQRIDSTQPPAPLGLVVAADVLYDKGSAAPLLTLIHALAQTNGATAAPPRIIIAQKIRSDTLQLDLGEFSCRTLTLFTCTLLAEDRAVRVWDLHVRD